MEFSQNYCTLLDEKRINISGGQNRLVGLAGALWTKPKFIILDKPTLTMDCNTENFVLNLLNTVKKDACIMMETRHVKIIRFSGRIYIFENGQIQVQGRHDQLMQSENLNSLTFQECVLSE